MFPYRCDTFTTANVSVLNVSTAIVNTINASSITSDMTIGANLNGGSLTIGSANSTVNVSGIRVNIGNNSGALASNNGVNIATGTNFDASSYVQMGNVNLPTIYLRSNVVNINDTGLSATGRINIGAGANATGSQLNIGSDSLPENIIKGKSVLINSQTGGDTSIGADGGGTTNIRGTTNIGTSGKTTIFKGNTIVDGSTINSGTNIFCIKQKTGDFSISTTDFIEDPFDITSPSGSTTANVTLGMGIDTTRKVGYINCAMSGYFRPLVLGPRNGNIYIGYLPTGFDNIGNSYTNNTYGNLVVSGNIYCGSPIIPRYSYPVSSPSHIGYKFSASFFGAQTTYSGGDRAYGWWYIPPGVYVIAYTSVYNRTTSYYKSFIYWTTQTPNSTNYFISMNGGGYSEASIVEWNNEAIGYHRTTGSAVITLTVSSYIAIAQNFFYPGGPTDYVGYGIDVVRVG